MKTWKKRIKLKPRRWFSVMGCIPCRNAKERHEAKLAESIYKKRTFWPDRLIPLTEEEQEFDSRPTMVTAAQMNAYLDKFCEDAMNPCNDGPVLVSEKYLKEFIRVCKPEPGWLDEVPGGVEVKE